MAQQVESWLETPRAREMADAMRECTENCRNCESVCLETLDHVVAKGGEYARPELVRALQDCVETCRASASFMLRGSDLHARVCGVCAEACMRCADACAEFPEDAQLTACAEACRACADSCREMAAHDEAGTHAAA